MIQTKLYLYNGLASDYKGTDYSANILTGNSWTDDLTEVLDTCELTLVGLDKKEEFEPTTKFILELWESDADQPYETLSLCVAEDVVSQPILSDDHYFTHSITFNEASVIAQGRIVDNCSETFELKDVNINAESSFNPEAKAKPIIEGNSASELYSCGYNYIYSSGFNSTLYWETIKYKRKFEWVFTEEYMSPLQPDYGSKSDWENLDKYQSVNGSGTITLPIPLMATYFGKKSSSTEYETNMNLCSVQTKVYYSTDNGATWTQDTSVIADDVQADGTIYTNPSTSVNQENTWVADWRFQERYGSDLKGYGMSWNNSEQNHLYEYYRKFAEYDNVIQNRFVTITIYPNRLYKVIVEPRLFASSNLGDHTIVRIPYRVDFMADTSDFLYTYSYASMKAQMTDWILGYRETHDNLNIPITFSSPTSSDGKPSCIEDFATYIAGQNLSIMFKSAPAISVYDLIQDVLLKTETIMKQQGVYIKNTPLAYYLDPSDLNILQNTEIIESSFHQKNLWEVLLEAGKYIHAIPYIEFGADDRLVIRWRYLGQTNKAKDIGTTISIFNSKSIENYVGALNSYVTNMIQRGAQIDEYVAPKSESEDYLVYNDVAVIKTSKPIIEILGLSFRCIKSGGHYTASSTEYDITNYVYENNIYELLDVVSSTIPNKGLAIYYNLGENVIRGLNYQLPSVNAGDGDTEYAIKRIIGTAYEQGIDPQYWKNIKINDFVFHITYRTKENIRSVQSRPDLRKYLINSSYENIPQHIQFNNQQDVSVDSIKMGNQVYGKLIRTGNSEYTTTEWNESLDNLKRAGELVNLRGNIFYVSKVKHTFFQDHIESEITYTMDYNQLSEIIGIPSEPRFYEISERNIVDREVNINQTIFVGTKFGTSHGFLTTERWAQIESLLFNNAPYPKYALTQFKNDIDNPDATIGLGSFMKSFIHPVSTYSMRNTLTLNWKMIDNFSAGDRVVDLTNAWKDSSTAETITNTSYSELVPMQYTDLYGRADLIDFAIIDDIESSVITSSTIKGFPICPYRFSYVTLSADLGQNAQDGYYDYLTYKYDSNSTPVQITMNTNSFTIKGSFYGGGIFDTNNNNITENGVFLYDYFILFNNNQFGIYACTEQLSGVSTFTLIEVAPSLDAIKNLAKNDCILNLDIHKGKVFASSCNFSNAYSFGTHNYGIILDKDNRESISFNYNLQMLTDSDRFVLSGYMWQQNKGTIKIALLTEEVNKIINNTIPMSSIKKNYDIYEIYNLTTQVDGLGKGIVIDIDGSLPPNYDFYQNGIKSIALVSENHPSVGADQELYFVMARNIGDIIYESEIRKNWYISTASQDFFKKQ